MIDCTAFFRPVSARARHYVLTVTCLLTALSLACTASGQTPEAPTGRLASHCGAADSLGAVALRAPNSSSGLSLCNGRSLALGANSGSLGTPLALASSDFDEDGVADLVSAFSSGSGGTIVVHRGNVAALWPYGSALQNGTPQAFLPGARSFGVSEAPDLVVAGDFDADGHMDVVTAHRGSSALYFFKGTGHGTFLAAKQFGVPGRITDMVAGEINQPDGLSDLAVGVNGDGGPAAVVYQSPLGALKASPETYLLNQAPATMALGKFAGSTKRDLLIGAGSELTLIHGRDRQLAGGGTQSLGPATVTRQTLAYGIVSLASGDFTGRAPSVAALGSDGSMHVLEHSVSATALAETLGGSSSTPSLQVAGGSQEASAPATGALGMSSAQRRVTALRAMAKTASQNGAEWTEQGTVALPGGVSQSAHALVAARISGSLQEDLVIVDRANSQVHVLSTSSREAQRRSGATALASVSTAVPQMKMMASLAASSSPAAVLPMRLSQHGLNGLVALQSGEGAPVVMPQDVAPTNVFTVTNTLDITDISQKNSPPPGSLRAAMLNAQAASEDNGGGTYSIVFNIPTSDPGYNTATGIFKIQPLSENVPNSLDAFALPPINATLTIDGYTQPGASPNTSTTADNAKIMIQIDGGKATTPGGAGLVPFDDVGTVIRGIAFTGWVTPLNTSGTSSGAEGIEANGVGDFIEGNFFGTPDGKTNGANRLGIFADNGPAFGSGTGNVIGGTTPQARNILSGNSNSGILFLSTALEAQLQGNFVGLDVTGKAIVPNPQQANRSNIYDGVGLNGPTVTIGGTLAGSGNVIAGNGTNVDLNDLTNGGAAKNSLVVGNLIGTDATGTVAIPSQGYGVSLLHGVSSMTIGGTTPAARNIISGNLAGVYIFDNSLNNVVQGNYIGTDITGTVAVPNTGQGIISGSTTTTTSPAASTTIGGAILGAGNVISGNGADGIQISGAYSSSPGYSPYVGSTIQGNFIGTDATGTKALPNQGNGISFLSGATNNSVGGANGGVGNVIANNTQNGILIDPGTGNGPGVANTTVANMIFSNGGAGVRVKSGTANRISANSIYGNSALGIDIDAAGPGTNSHCNATSTGANMLQNYPVLTAGTGTTFITATATDSSGNTSEFSKAVAATQTANLLSLLGSFDGVANSSYTLEFFSNPSADPSGYGQGKTFLGSTTIKTDANCSGTITDPVDLSQADVSVSLTTPSNAALGPDMGIIAYSALVTNNGPATAHNVVFTDTLPSQLKISSMYCNVGVCQSPITVSQGTCTVSGQTITCNLGTVATGGAVNISIPVQVLVAGSITNVANVMATEVDPNLLNNMSSTTLSASYPYAFVDHVDPAVVLVNSPDLPVNVYGVGFTADSAVTFNSTTPLKVLGVVDNQVCGGAFQPSFCTALQVVVPASLLATAGSYTIDVTNPSSYASSTQFTVAPSCTYSVFSSLDDPFENSGTNLIASGVSVTTNVQTCPWTATSSVPWASILDNASAQGSGSVDVAIAPNTTTSSRTGSVTVAGKTFTFSQSAGSASICSVGLDPATVSVGSVGGSGSVNATLSNSSCAPFAETYPQSTTAAPNVQWITVTNKSSLLIASGPVTYTVAQNNGPARAGAIVVGGNVTTVTQAAPSCYFTLSTSSVLASAAGTTGSITVTPTPSTCTWTATPSNASQISVTSGASGTGTGTVNYTVAANTGGPITPSISIGNSAAMSVFTVNQASANTCTFTLSPASSTVTSNGISSYFEVNASFSFCKWTAVSNNPDGLSITGPTSGTGSGPVYYSVAQNGGTARTLTITAGCQTFTLNQSAPLVTVANNPAPVLTSLQPASTTAGSAAFTLTVNGTGFINGSTVNFNGSARTTTYISATQLSAAITANDVLTQGTASITVTTPSPGGGTSNALPFTINAAIANNPVPVLTALQPASVTAGSGALTLTVNGTGFVSGATVNFKGAARVTTFVSATQLSAALLAGDTASAGTATVSVTNPTPGGGTSNALTFTVNPVIVTNPVPAISTLQPTSVVAGSNALTLTINGTNFLNTSTVTFNGSSRVVTFVSSTQLTVALLSTDIANAGSVAVVVTNPTPGGGASNTATFAITAASSPSFSLSASNGASTIPAGGSAQYTITAAAQNGTYSSPVVLSATGLPSGASATFSPTSITPGSTSATSTLTIQVPLHSQLIRQAGVYWPWLAAILPMFIAILKGRSRRRLYLLLALLAICCAGGLSGCGGGFAYPGTSSQTYNVTVTGTSGAIQQTTTIKLTVNF